jgi:hypothetical protein
LGEGARGWGFMDATLSIGEGPCYGAGPSEGRIPPAPQAGTHPLCAGLSPLGEISRTEGIAPFRVVDASGEGML